MKNNDVSEHARALALLGAQKGGQARASSLTKKERQEIARYAAEVRWKGKETEEISTLRKVICGSPDRPLTINDIQIQCYVLEDETRVLSQGGLQLGVGLSRGGASAAGTRRLVQLVNRIGSRAASKQLMLRTDTDLLAARLKGPIMFVTPWGKTALGYEATILADICDAVLEAREHGLLLRQQVHLAARCEILLRGFARVGIIALVDEVTGYQLIRPRTAIEQLLKRYISEELQKWVKTFQDDFYIQLFRLRNWQYTDINKRPGGAAWLTIDIVYKRLAPNVLDELKKKTPRDDKGRLKNRLFQHLTPDYGHPRLREHLAAVTTLMTAARNWNEFYFFLERAKPKYNTTLPLLVDYPKSEVEALALPSPRNISK